MPGDPYLLPGPLIDGAAAGLAIAAPIGPLGMLCIQRCLRNGPWAGFGTGLGGATTTVGYAAVLLLGSQGVAPLLAANGRVLAAAGGLLLLWSAVRVLTSAPPLPDAAGTAPAMGWASCYLSGLALNVLNPMSLILIVAALSPTLHAGLPSAAGRMTLLAGMGASACAWWACLSLCVGVLRSALSAAMLRAVNRLAGCALGLYAAATLVRAWGPWP